MYQIALLVYKSYLAGSKTAEQQRPLLPRDRYIGRQHSGWRAYHGRNKIRVLRFRAKSGHSEYNL